MKKLKGKKIQIYEKKQKGFGKKPYLRNSILFGGKRK